MESSRTYSKRSRSSIVRCWTHRTLTISQELDWETIATRFHVDLPFLLQQAAWLYERHFEGMRKQMRKLGVSQAPSPVPSDSASASAVAAGMKQAPKDPRMPSVINTLKAQPSVTGSSEGSTPGTPRVIKPAISRTPSTTTVTQSRILAGSGLRSRSTRGQRGSSGSSRKPTLTARPTAGHDDEHALSHDGPSDSDSEEEPSMARSQAFRRGPLSKRPALRALSSDEDAEDDEDDSSGGYLPFAAASKPIKEGPSTTLRDATRGQAANKADPPPPTARAPLPAPDSSTTSSACSAAQQPPDAQRPGPISPRHRAQLASAKEGSEGSPSMGSSFSDLDDASVTRSDLEEALMSRMQRGSAFSIGSRLGIGGGGGKGRQG